MRESSPIQVSSRRDVMPRSCCICLDVRIGAVMIGLFNLIIHSAGLVMTASVVMNHKQEKSLISNWMETHDNRYYNAFTLRRTGVDHMLGVMIACLSFFFTVMLVYGAAMRRAVYMLPFFCMQVFDLSLYVLASAAVLSFAPQIKRVLEMNPQFQKSVAQLNESQFQLFLLSVCFCILMLKIYLMYVVWDCFKYCRELTTSANRENENTETGAGNHAVLIFPGEKGNAMAILPSYEDTVKVAPPPAYKIEQDSA